MPDKHPQGLWPATSMIEPNQVFVGIVYSKEAGPAAKQSVGVVIFRITRRRLGRSSSSAGGVRADI